MRLVFRERKGQTGSRDGNGDGGECERDNSRAGIKNEGGCERALSGDDRAREDEEKEGGPRRHGRREWEGEGTSRSAEERHLMGRMEKSRGKEQTFEHELERCQSHPDRWNVRGNGL